MMNFSYSISTKSTRGNNSRTEIIQKVIDKYQKNPEFKPAINKLVNRAGQFKKMK